MRAGLRSFLRRALIVCLSIGAMKAYGQQIPQPGAAAANLNFLPGHYLIRRKPGVTQQGLLDDLKARADGAQVEVIQDLAEQGLMHVRIAAAPTMSRDVGASRLAEKQQDQSALLAASDNVALIEPVVQYRLAQVASEADQATQALRATLDRIAAPEAWSLQRPAGRPIVVAVIDTGVFLEHEMFKGLIVQRGYDVTRDQPDASAQRLPSGAYEDHGTRVTGMVASVLRAGPGGAGPLPNVQILPIRATRLSADRSQQVVLTPDAIKAIDYAVKSGAKIINVSWGETVPSTELREAMKRANDRGVSVIAAAGNGKLVGLAPAGYDIDAELFYPASYKLPNIVGVSATNEDDALATWSNWGKTNVETAAPGEQVMTPIPYFNAATNQTASGYGPASGTSFAAPLVAGATAMLLSTYPNLTTAQVTDLLTRGVQKLSPLEPRVASGGRLNVAVLFSEAAPAMASAPPVAPAPEAVAQGGKVPVDIRAYANNALADVKTQDQRVYKGYDAAGLPSDGDEYAPAPNRFTVIMNLGPGRRPLEVLKGASDLKVITSKRTSFLRNIYVVTVETQRDEAALLAEIGKLKGVRHVEGVQAYQLQGGYGGRR